MKVRISQMFHDKADYNKVYLVGETYTFDDARAEALIARGLVESAEAVVVKAEDIIEVSEVAAPEGSQIVESVEIVEKPKAVKPVAAKRKSTSKTN